MSKDPGWGAPKLKWGWVAWALLGAIVVTALITVL